MLGGCTMSVPNARLDSRDDDVRCRLSRALGLLNEALSQLDRLTVSPAIGARLQDVIVSLEELTQVTPE